MSIGEQFDEIREAIIQLCETIRVGGFTPRLDKIIEKWKKEKEMIKRFREGKKIEETNETTPLQVYRACRKAVNEHNFDGKCTEECRQAILGNMQRKWNRLRKCD